MCRDPPVEMCGKLLVTQLAGQLSAETGFWVWRGLVNEMAGHALSGDPGKASEDLGMRYPMGGMNVSPHVSYDAARGKGSLNGR